ncbi:MAG TPA: hypothetical protein VMZ06_06765 [Candidatus Bathyarchaeia archaeon]|nr:hypothetical protein [Candidatus Bathyarchaeia archaeon]
MRKRIRGWRGWLAAVALLAALLVNMFLMFFRSDVVYCPHDAQWIISSEDFPAFYRNLLKTDLAKAVNDEAPEHYAAWQLAVRQDTGIRPTPLRWRVWLGRRLFAAVSENGWGACVRPGMLLRVADTLRGVGHWRPAVRQFGPYYYAWRGGALIFSCSEKYVLNALRAQPCDSPLGGPFSDELWVYETQAARFALRIRPSRHIHVSGWLEGGQLAARQSPLGLDSPPEDAAIAWAAASTPKDLRVLAEAVWRALDRHARVSVRPWFQALKDLAQKAVSSWSLDALSPNWDQQLTECSLLLFDVDDSEPLPVPEIGLVLRSNKVAGGSHPLESITNSGPRLPYEWDGHPGIVAPRAGEKAAICLTSSGADWLAASQEPAMARLIAILQQPTQQCQVDKSNAVVAVNWTKAAARAQPLARKAAALELFSGLNSTDLEKRVAPLLRALARQGCAHLHWRQNDGRLEFSGALTGGPAK